MMATPFSVSLMLECTPETPAIGQGGVVGVAEDDAGGCARAHVDTESTTAIDWSERRRAPMIGRITKFAPIPS
jgi:hypothetical protein